MSFVQDDAPDKNDRLLMFSMLGVVVMTLLAFGIAHFGKAAGSAEVPANRPAVSSEVPATVAEQAPKYESSYDESGNSQQSSPTPTTPENPSPTQKFRGAGGRTVKNAKLQIWREMTAED